MLGNGPMRFGELRRATEGISQRMLALTLRGSERDGLVTRTVEATIPPKVEYELTDLGRTLPTPVHALAQWAIEHRMRIHEAQQRYDAENARDEDAA
jgi:DNA-binding HxlR family transcriptional regulator